MTFRTDYCAAELRRLAKSSKNINQSRKLFSLAALVEGMNRADAAQIGGMDRRTLRDWVRWFNTVGRDGLLNRWSPGPSSRLAKSIKNVEAYL